MRPGEEVIATAFGNKEIKRIVVQVNATTIVICKREEWEAAKAENRRPRGVGFPAFSVKLLKQP